MSATNPAQTKPLRASARFIAAGALQLWFVFYFSHGGALGVGMEISDLVKEVLFVLIPSMAALFLLPVFIRGSRSQKILAIVLFLMPAWFAYQGWSGFIVNHLLN